jgi:hypothetical protein
MGFVGEPDSDTNESGSYTDDEDVAEDEADESTGLIRKSLPRTQSSQSKVPTTSGHTQHGHKRRRRAATLKEVKAIWGALGDSDDRYGTFERPTSANSHPGHSTSDGQPRQKRRRRSSAGRPLIVDEDDEADAGVPERLSRSSTLPANAHRHTRRRSSYHGSALFSDLLKGDWWYFKRKDKDEHDDENDERQRLTGHDRHGNI